MKLDDFFDLERGPESIVRLAALALVIVVIAGLVTSILSQFTAADLLLALIFLGITSPIAYAIREQRLGREHRPRNRNGAERTPLVPPVEEDEI